MFGLSIGSRRYYLQAESVWVYYTSIIKIENSMLQFDLISYV